MRTLSRLTNSCRSSQILPIRVPFFPLTNSARRSPTHSGIASQIAGIAINHPTPNVSTTRPRRVSVKLPPQLPLKFYVIVLPIVFSCVFLVVGLISRDIRLARERAAVNLTDMKVKLVAELPFMVYEPTYNWGQSCVSGTEWDAEVFLEAASCLDFSRTPASRKVNDEALTQISRVNKLKTIDLRHTQVTDACLPHLAKCDRLLLVAAGGTKITPEGARWLEAEKPGCLVFLVDPPPDVKGWAEANELREMQRRAEGIRRY